MRLITGSLSRRNLGRGATAILLSGVLLTSGCGGESDASQAKIPPEGILTAGLRNEWDKVERVLDRMDDVDVRVTTGLDLYAGRTLLMMAAESDTVDMVGKLLERGADPQARDAMERTPLHFAMRTCSLEIVILLLRAGGTLNVRDRQPFRHRTPMDLACHCPVPFIEALIAEGGDPCDADAEGRNLACYAAIAGNTELVRHLFSTRACPEDEASWRRLLIAAAEAQHDDGIEIVRWIFQNHDPDDLLDPQTSGHALFNAAASESPLLFRMLLDTGANPLHAPSGLYDAPVLVLVAGWNRHGGDHAPDLVAELIEKGADPAQQDPHSGRDAVLAAVARGRPETLERLIQLGASLDTRDRAGRSPHDILKSHLLIPGSLMERKQTILREAMHSSNGQ